jgi:hypothetical protein
LRVDELEALGRELVFKDVGQTVGVREGRREEGGGWRMVDGGWRR